MSNRNKPKFYTVWNGRETGVFASWAETQESILGYPNAKYRSFGSRAEAEAALRGKYSTYAGKNTKTLSLPLEELAREGVRMDALAVDAACAGVPGPMEYRGVRIGTGEQLFHAGPYEDGTNNIGEFLAIVDGLRYLNEQGEPDLPLYSDSYNARKWVRDKECRTNLVATPDNAVIFLLIADAVQWLRNNRFRNPILTWETEKWGENPADFGRK